MKSHVRNNCKSMFGGGHLGCKCPLLEPHFGYFLARSAAMGKKMSLLRTQNQPFSPPKHHLQTCSNGMDNAARRATI